MKTKVLAIPEVIDYLNELVDILYEKRYFSFEDTSVEYVVELFEDIITNLPVKPGKPAPKHFDQYGKDMEYAAFKKVNTQRGTSFSTFTKRMRKSYIWCDT